MSDQTAAGAVSLVDPSLKYKALIAEAYINPIEPVIAVDNDFPSLDAMLGQFVASSWVARRQ